MELSLSTGQNHFLEEVRAFLEPWIGLNGFLVSESADVDSFYRALAARNWIAISWPETCGGLGRPAIEEFLLWNEIARRRIARPPQGAGVVAKTIMRYGTEEQKAHWLPRIRNHQSTFALAYSEPEAGSDLASLRCAAVRQADQYLVNGNKCWNSRAHRSDYLWLLCRTGEQAARGKALSLMIVDSRLPGVRIKPLQVMDGNVFAEIFFDGATVPATCRIGAENQAWSMMAEALADERHVHFGPGRILADLESVSRFFERQGLDKDPLVQFQMVDVALDALEAEALSLRVLEATVKGRAPVAEVAANKVAHVRAIQSIARTAMKFGGPEAALDADISLMWRQTTTESIGGGTTEIMQSIVARQRLGLGSVR